MIERIEPPVAVVLRNGYTATVDRKDAALVAASDDTHNALFGASQDGIPMRWTRGGFSSVPALDIAQVTVGGRMLPFYPPRLP